MALFNFGTILSSESNFYFGTINTGTETSFNFIEDGYTYNDYTFHFGYTRISSLVVKSTATPGYTINSINVEHIDGTDVLYINTVSGIVRGFSSSCSGTILDIDIVSSDYVSGSCAAELLYAGNDDKLLEITAASGIVDTFVFCDEVVEVLYYSW